MVRRPYPFRNTNGIRSEVQPARDRIGRLSRQIEIDDRAIRPVRAHHRQGIGHAGGVPNDGAAESLQHLFQGHGHDQLVLDHQHSQARQALARLCGIAHASVKPPPKRRDRRFAVFDIGSIAPNSGSSRLASRPIAPDRTPLGSRSASSRLGDPARLLPDQTHLYHFRLHTVNGQVTESSLLCATARRPCPDRAADRHFFDFKSLKSLSVLQRLGRLAGH